MRMLFLDDDPIRAASLAATRPEAVWVTTVEDCLEQLEEPWDEVHLDHDLGGETFVDHERQDCGMAVVRWLCEEPRPHLQTARFVIHTHNPNAGCVMSLHLQVKGYRAEVRPFGQRSSGPGKGSSAVHRVVSHGRRLLAWLTGRPARPSPLR